MSFGQLELTDVGRDGAPVREERHVETRERLPSVFGVQVHDGVIAKAEVVEAAVARAAAERRLEVEGDGLSRAAVGRRGLEASLKREDTLLVEDGEELLQQQVDGAETVAIEVEVRVFAPGERVEAAGARVVLLVAIVHRAEHLAEGKVRLFGEARRGGVGEAILDRGKSLVRATADRSVEPPEPCAGFQPRTGRTMARPV